ncbi:MAG: peptidylprolyl isomerase [Acidimicrobiales bacterium]|jgi:cyclophilin family peptidyl-prolyl cis-trans isomerase|nr:peptidylprolyl isomerase [Acidimicrobiales bacterium]
MATSARGRRDEARRRETAAADRRRRSRRRRTQILAASIAALVLLSTVAAGIAATRGTSTPAASSTSTTLPDPADTTRSPDDYPTTGVAPVAVAPGAALTGPTPCPDASSPRTTSFAEPPPMCIDTGRFYSAVVTTTAGSMTFQLNPQRAPASVNAFVVLAGYAFYDGQPVTRIEPTAWFEVGGAFTDGSTASAFPIPDEVPEAGQIFTSGTIAMTGAGTPGTNQGAFLVATFENAPAIDPGVTAFGVMLDGAATLAAIDRLGSQSGLPVRPVRVESVTITPGAPIPSPPPG